MNNATITEDLLADIKAEYEVGPASTFLRLARIEAVMHEAAATLSISAILPGSILRDRIKESLK